MIPHLKNETTLIYIPENNSEEYVAYYFFKTGFFLSKYYHVIIETDTSPKYIGLATKETIKEKYDIILEEDWLYKFDVWKS